MHAHFTITAMLKERETAMAPGTEFQALSELYRKNQKVRTVLCLNFVCVALFVFAGSLSPSLCVLQAVCCPHAHV